MNLLQQTRPMMNLVRGRPVAAVFEVCLRCNSACGYCNLPLNEGRYEMSLAEINRVFADLYRDGLRHIFVQGGEPTVRIDLFEVLEALSKLGFSLSLVTNGTRLTAERVERLSIIGPSLSVSLDTLDRERYRRIRGADQLPRVLRGIDTLREYPHPKYLTCVVSHANLDEALDVVRFARDLGFIPVIGVYHWDVENYGKPSSDLQFVPEAVIEVLREIDASGLVPPGYFRNYLRDNIRWLMGERLSRCDAGRHTIAIDASGNVSACLAHSAAGNLRDHGLAEILDMIDRQAVRDCSDRSSCNLLCGRIVGSNLRDPVAALKTPWFVEPLTEGRSAAAYA